MNCIKRFIDVAQKFNQFQLKIFESDEDFSEDILSRFEELEGLLVIN